MVAVSDVMARSGPRKGRAGGGGGVVGNGEDGVSGRRARHSLLERTVSDSSAGSSHLAMTPMGESGVSSTVTSGRSTPVPENALPSVKSLSSARRHVRAEQRRRIFPTIEYTSRVSHFDPTSDYRDFHGFFNLFWIGLAIMAMTTILRNIKDTGYPMRVQIWGLFTVKLWHLAIADLLMVLSTAVSLPLHRVFRSAARHSSLTWNRGGMAVQAVYQLAWISGWVALPFLLDWTWTAQVFFLLHAMVLLMKMHSYAFYNGHLSETEKRLRDLDNPSTTASRAPAYVYPHVLTPRAKSSGAATGADVDPSQQDDQEASSRRRHRRRHRNGSAKGKKDGPHTSDTTIVNETDNVSDQTTPAPQEIDDEKTSDSENLDTLREELALELTSPIGNVTYPQNLTWTNYADYLLCPTLCYELEYPRTDSINWPSLGSKIAATFGCISLLTVMSEEFILPVLMEASAQLNDPNTTLTLSDTLLILAESISWLLFPFMLVFLLVFLVIFEYVLGAFAEITFFADRHFYSDWWNSTDWMEFSREWNVPVYSFLRRHVYSASRPHTGRPLATAITFLVSAIGHEVVMACITKKIRGYGFVCQMLQLPIVAVQRTRFVRERKTLNNVMFWCSMILGLSLICSLYVLI